MALTITVTNAGRAALVNASNTGTAPVTIAQVGLSATAVVPSAAATALPGEFKRLATLSGDVVADDTIHLIVRDEGSDVFTVRSLGLYLADGTLFAIYGQANVLVEKSAQAMMLIALDVQFADVAATELTFGDANFLNPPATTTTQGVVELATVAEAQAGIDALRALTPATAKAAILGWLLTQDGAGSGIDADLLDGQHGAYYTDIPARLGFNPINKTGDAMTGPLTLSGDPAAAGHAARKSYVDALVTAAALLAKLVTVDGAGSGLDADLLDGQQGSYYTDITARLGYTPLNVTAYTASDVRSKLLTLDGSGSGIDADLLDGQQGSYYTDIAARLGYTPVNTAGDTMTGLMIFGRNSGEQVRFGYDTAAALDPYLAFYHGGLTRTAYIQSHRTSGIIIRNDLSAAALIMSNEGTLSYGGSFIWHAGNDGAGSTLDADLLDGQHGAYYRDLANSTGTLPNARFSGSYDGITEMSMSRIRLLSGTDVTLGSTTHAFQIGASTGSNIIADANEIQARNNGAAADLALNLEGGDVLIGSGTAWHSANDGAGSGLDADLLDGYQGSAYDRIVSQSLVENGGYITYASGRKECWGIVNITTEDAYYTVNLPVGHTDWVLPIGGGMTLSTSAQENTAVRDIQYDGSGRPVSFRIYNAAGTGGGFPFRWRSIGK